MKTTTQSPSAFFAPQLTLKNVSAGVEFYKKALGATVLRQWDNPDGSIHVAEMEISGAMFHLHEEVPRTNQLSAETAGTSTCLIGIFVDDPHAIVKSAEEAGAKVINPVQDYDYGYRQGTFVDPFGHQWMIEKRI